MASEKETGGPAFPHQYESCGGHPNWRESQGMTLRDYFAGQAIKPLLDARGDGDDWSVEAVAADAYRLADAMLEARET